MSDKVLPAILDDMLIALKEDYEKHQHLDNFFIGLNSIFETSIIENAFELIDHDSVYLIECQQRHVFQVVGSKGDIYTILPSSNFCKCNFFKNQVMENKSLCCKHFLAAKIAVILKKYRNKIETPRGLTSIMYNALRDTFE